MRKLTEDQMAAALRAIESLPPESLSPALRVALEKLRDGLYHKRKARLRKEFDHAKDHRP